MEACRIKIYNKLVRDKIPAILESKAVPYTVRELDDKEYADKLDEKLKEELEEYMEAGDAEKLAELADLVEVIYAIVNKDGNSRERFEDIRRTKREERGAFDKRLLLIYTGE